MCLSSFDRRPRLVGVQDRFLVSFASLCLRLLVKLREYECVGCPGQCVQGQFADRSSCFLPICPCFYVLAGLKARPSARFVSLLSIHLRAVARPANHLAPIGPFVVPHAKVLRPSRVITFQLLFPAGRFVNNRAVRYNALLFLFYRLFLPYLRLLCKRREPVSRVPTLVWARGQFRDRALVTFKVGSKRYGYRQLAFRFFRVEGGVILVPRGSERHLWERTQSNDGISTAAIVNGRTVLVLLTRPNNRRGQSMWSKVINEAVQRYGNARVRQRFRPCFIAF